MTDSLAGAVRQITVVRPGALGDTLLTLPALALLRRWAPDARLTFIARADTLPLALASGLAERAWPWDLPDWGVLFASQGDGPPLTPRAQTALAQADVVIVWAPDPTGAMARRLSALGAGQVIVAPAQPPPSGAEGGDQAHEALWLAATLRPLGVAPPVSLAALTKLTPRLQAPVADIAQADALWRALRLPEQVVALHPGSGSQRKRWPADRFAEVARLARDAGYHPLLLAGEADEQAMRETQAALARLGMRTAAVPLAQGLRVATLAALLARCVGFVGCDAGVSHLAGLVGAPTVAIFGPTDPARWSPLGPRVCAVRAPDAQLDHLSPDAVWAALHGLLPASAQR